MDFPASGNALWAISDSLGIRPEWLLTALNFESGLNPAADNGVGYVGLNQISESQLSAMGIDPQDYKSWAASQQLSRVVGPYFRNLIDRFGPLRSAIRVEQANFLPATLDTARGLSSVITQAPSAFYEDNKVFDKNGDGKITLQDLATTLGPSASSQRVRDAISQTYALRPWEIPTDPIYGFDFMSPLATVVVAASAAFLITLGVSYYRPDLLPRWARLPV